MGNNGVCWGSGESSGLVQRFLNMARERIEASVKCYYFRVRKKMGTMSFLFSMRMKETVGDSQCVKLHVFMSDVIKGEFHFRKSILFWISFGNWKECQHLQNSLPPLIYLQVEEKK